MRAEIARRREAHRFADRPRGAGVGGSTRTADDRAIAGRAIGSAAAPRDQSRSLRSDGPAAVQGGHRRRPGGESGAGGNITPHTLGIKCLDVPESFTSRPSEHRFAPIVKRNAPLPASQSEVFCTVYDSQPTVEIDVYQGESPDVRRNHRVGKFLYRRPGPRAGREPHRRATRSHARRHAESVCPRKSDRPRPSRSPSTMLSQDSPSRSATPPSSGSTASGTCRWRTKASRKPRSR